MRWVAGPHERSSEQAGWAQASRGGMCYQLACVFSVLSVLAVPTSRMQMRAVRSLASWRGCGSRERSRTAMLRTAAPGPAIVTGVFSICFVKQRWHILGTGAHVAAAPHTRGSRPGAPRNRGSVVTIFPFK